MPRSFLRGGLLESLPDASGEEVVDVLRQSGGVRIERIVSHGERSPDGFWYDQGEGEWVTIVKGSAGLQIEGRDGVLTLGPGDWVDLPAGCRHRVAWTADNGPTVWLAVFYPPAD